MIYMDNVAGTKPDKRVVDKMIPYFSEFYGNPSAHFYPLGRESFDAIAEARKNVAELIGAQEDEVIFTSSGTESNNMAIKGILLHPKNASKKHVIISEIEHFSIQNTVIKFINEGYKITKLKVGKDGRFKIKDLKNAITDETVLISLMHANPEVGVIQCVEEAGAVCKDKGIVFHVDAVASCGHIPVDVNLISCDLLSIAAQNFYGPKGAAALYIRNGVKLVPLFDGGQQEMGYRSGSENVPAIVGMGEAARIAKNEMSEYSKSMNILQDKLINGIEKMFDFIHFTGDTKGRLPGHVSFWVEYIEGESLLLWLALKGVAAASGSACSSNLLAEDEEDLEASHVLTAVGVPTDICAGSITFSMSKYNTEEEVNTVLEITPEIIMKLCEMSPDYNRNK